MALIDNDASPEKKKAARQHKEKLAILREAFDAERKRITEATKEEVARYPESATDKRAAILAEEQKALDKILAELSTEINKANHEFLATLEKLEKDKDEMDLKSLLS